MSENNISELNSVVRKRWAKRIVIFVVVIILVLVGIALYVFRDQLNLDAVRRYIKYLDVTGDESTGSFTYDSGNLNRYAEFGDGLAVASVAGLATYDENGKEFVLEQTQLSLPEIQSSGSVVLAYDVGGTALRAVRESDAGTLEVTAEQPILDADLAGDGCLCYSTSETGFRSVLYAYDSDQTLSYCWRSSSEYLPVCTIAPGGKYMAATALGVTEGAFSSSIVVFRTDEEEPEARFTVGNEMLYDLEFLSSDTLCAVGEETLFFYKTDGTLLGSYSYGGAYLKDFDLSGNGFITLVLNRNKAGNFYEILTVDETGTVLGQIDYDTQILDISVSDKYIGILNAETFGIYDSALNVYHEADNGGWTNLVQRADATAIMLGAGTGTVYVP